MVNNESDMVSLLPLPPTDLLSFLFSSLPPLPTTVNGTSTAIVCQKREGDKTISFYPLAYIFILAVLTIPRTFFTL